MLVLIDFLAGLTLEEYLSDVFSAFIGLFVLAYALSNIWKGLNIPSPEKIHTPKGVRYLAPWIIETATGGYLRPFMPTDEAEELIELRKEYIIKKGLSTLGSSAVIAVPSKIFSTIVPLINALPTFELNPTIYISIPVTISSLILTGLVAAIYGIVRLFE